MAESKIPPDLERRIREAVGRSKKSINAKTKPDSKDRDEDSTVREAKAKARALEESNEDSVSFRALREKYARWVFIYLVIYSAVCGVLLVLHGLKCIEFGLPDTVLEYLVGSTAVSAIGLVLAVTHGLFKK